MNAAKESNVVGMRYISEYIRDFVQVYLRVRRETLNIVELISDLKGAKRLAEAHLSDPNSDLRAAANALNQALEIEMSGVRPARRIAPASPVQAAPESAPAPSSTEQYSRQWSQMETQAVDLFGPMGGKVVQKVKNTSGGDPFTREAEMASLLGAQRVKELFLRTRRVL